MPCVRPTLELWNDRLRQIFAAPPPLNCSSAERNWIYVDNASFRIDESAIRRHGPVDCQCNPVKRGRNDFEVCTSILLLISQGGVGDGLTGWPVTVDAER